MKRLLLLIVSLCVVSLPSWVCRADEPAKLPTGAIRRFGPRSLEIDQEVRGCAISRDGRYLATMNFETLSIFENGSRQPLAQFKSEKPAPHFWLAFSPDGETLAMSSGNSPIYLLETRSGQELTRINLGASRASHGVFTSEPASLVYGDDKSVRVWSLAYRRQLQSIVAGGHVTRLALSPRDELVAVAESSSVTLWNLQTADKLRTFPKIDGFVQDLKFSPDGKHLYCAAHNTLTKPKVGVHVWQVADGQPLESLPGIEMGAHGLAINAAGNRLAVSCEDMSIQVFDLSSRKRLMQLEADGIAPSFLHFFDNDRKLLTAGHDPVRIWDLETQRDLSGRIGHVGSVLHLYLSGDGLTLVTLGDSDHTLRGWKVRTGEQVWRQHLRSMSRKGAMAAADLITVSEIAQFRRFDPQTGAEQAPVVLQPAGRAVAVLAAAPDGKSLLALSGNTVVRVDSASGAVLNSLGESKRVLASGIDKDKIYLVTDDGALLRHSYPQAGPVQSSPLAPQPIKAAGLSRDCRRLAFSTLEELVVIDTATGERVYAQKTGGDFVHRLTLSSDGQLLMYPTMPAGHLALYPTLDMGIEVIDLQAGRRLKRFDGFPTGASSAAFTSDRRQLITGHHNGSIYVWDLPQGEPTR